MQDAELDALYQATSAKTLALWREEEGTGRPVKGYYDTRKLALATGFQPPVSEAIAGLFSALQSLTAGDDRVDLQPLNGFHFTFVPLTLPMFGENQPLPAKTRQLIDAWSPFENQSVRIEGLRLVALAGQLLLAGIPSPPASVLRQAFCDAMLKTGWKDELLLRHANTPLPAPFWHTTLLRYQAERLPDYLRTYFLERQAQRYGEVSGTLKLVRINYNWTQCSPVDALPLEY